MILCLGYLGHHSWRFDAIGAVWCFDFAEEVLISHVYEAKLSMVSRSAVENSVENNRQHKHAVVGALNG
jgi:hypothetical protein